MQYGFVIDNRKCIGCHACTTACKSEHDVPVGVNRTWVKQVEKGVFPDTRRIFSVMRCNHCTDAPCVEICPVEALFYRDDGIVDFDKERCIGCKSCMQACPYDALYIDPETHTAAKCNYCAHRIDIGLEPACVNVCPEEAIISGDLSDPNSKISKLVAREQVTVRKEAKGTQPNLYYIDGDEAMLNPMRTKRSDQYFWSSQSSGVGHYARAADELSFSNGDVVETLLQDQEHKAMHVPKTIDVLRGDDRRIYDTPDKGILWGWEVSGYVFTKAIAAGIFLIAALGQWLGISLVTETQPLITGAISLFFLVLTGILLVMDLDQPGRFLYVLLRPQWNSWLTRGGYVITGFGGILTLWMIARYMSWTLVADVVTIAGFVLALVTAVYTAFLFAQAKGRDFWQSPSLSMHMLVHSATAGFAVIAIWQVIAGMAVPNFVSTGLLVSLLAGIALIALELMTTHPTREAEHVAEEIYRGRYRNKFWFGVLLVGTIIPAGLLLVAGSVSLVTAIAAALILVGIYITEHIWVEAPQRIQLT